MTQDGTTDDGTTDGLLVGLAEVAGSTTGIAPGRVTPDARLEEDLGIDSLALVDLVVAAEDRFGVIIADDTGRASGRWATSWRTSAGSPRCPDDHADPMTATEERKP